MSEEQSTNKRVTKNALALTLRMVLVTIVGLYTSRIVLEALGVDDYGIYGVIGGVVGMATFLNSSMAGATSRFITFELGRGNKEKLRHIFSTALIIHILIALCVLVLAETIGLWFVNNKMNFPSDRMFAVNVLYQFTIVSMAVNFTQVPYSAAIIAHEKMSIYAYFEILNVVLKLLIVYLLLIVKTDRLILYAALTTLVSLTIAFIYRWYCTKHFPCTHFSIIWDKQILKEMFLFSGYDLYGNMCVTAKTQGQPIILNLFFGVAANAAASISLTVTGAISGLTTTILQAFRPQIIKQYSVQNYKLSQKMACRALIYTLLAYTIIAIPIFIETETILYIWLGQAPKYTTMFIRLIITISTLGIVINTNNVCIHATGNIKRVSFISGSLYLMCPVLSYIVLRLGGPITTIYIVDIALLFIIACVGCRIIKIQIPQYNITSYTSTIIKALSCSIIALVLTRTIGKTITHNTLFANTLLSSIFNIFTIFTVGILFVASTYLFLLLNRDERRFLKAKCINWIKRNE